MQPPGLNTVDRQFLRMRSMKLEDRMNEDDDDVDDDDDDGTQSAKRLKSIPLPEL